MGSNKRRVLPVPAIFVGVFKDAKRLALAILPSFPRSTFKATLLKSDFIHSDTKLD